MKEYVIDASALVLALNGKTPGPPRSEPVCPARSAPDRCGGRQPAAPARTVGPDQPVEACGALRAAQALVEHRYPHTGALAARAWDLRDKLTFYDALYAAPAEHLGVPLLPGDARLSRAPGLPCQTELV